MEITAADSDLNTFFLCGTLLLRSKTFGLLQFRHAEKWKRNKNKIIRRKTTQNLGSITTKDARCN